MKVVGNTAANIANNTRYKVDEVTLQNRRREVLSDVAHKTYALWLKGEAFPRELDKLLQELKRLDEQLNDMRAEKYASSQREVTEENGEQQLSEDADTEEEVPEGIPPENSTVSTEINELFDTASSIGRSAEKVNSSLEQMSERIRRFPLDKRDEESTEGQE